LKCGTLSRQLATRVILSVTLGFAVFEVGGNWTPPSALAGDFGCAGISAESWSYKGSRLSR
jgi:hypothetical protein